MRLSQSLDFGGTTQNPHRGCDSRNPRICAGLFRWQIRLATGPDLSSLRSPDANRSKLHQRFVRLSQRIGSSGPIGPPKGLRARMDHTKSDEEGHCDHCDYGVPSGANTDSLRRLAANLYWNRMCPICFSLYSGSLSAFLSWLGRCSCSRFFWLRSGGGNLLRASVILYTQSCSSLTGLRISH